MTLQMLDNIQKEILRDDFMRLGLEVSGVGMGFVDYKTDTVVLDLRAAELFELPSNIELKRDKLHDRIHPDDMPDIERKLRDLFDSNQDGDIDVQHRIILANGETRWIEARKRVKFTDDVCDSAKSLEYGILAITDISVHKEAQLRIQFLLDELNHRSKNAMGVIQGMARLTASSDEEHAFAERFSDRLKGLSYNQDALVKNNRNHVDLQGLARFHMEAFSDEVANRVVIDGPEINLNSAAAQAIGMALHELSTNAVKYGAFSNSKGTVTIKWDKIEDDKPAFHINWKEDGGPKVAPPKRSGFGRKVLEKMAASSLNGEVDFDYRPEGLVWALKAPLSSVV